VQTQAVFSLQVPLKAQLRVSAEMGDSGLPDPYILRHPIELNTIRIHVSGDVVKSLLCSQRPDGAYLNVFFYRSELPDDKSIMGCRTFKDLTNLLNVHHGSGTMIVNNEVITTAGWCFVAHPRGEQAELMVVHTRLKKFISATTFNIENLEVLRGVAAPQRPSRATPP
jgi:hypothetical protein